MFEAHEKGTILHLHVQPGASKTGIAGRYGEALKVRIKAPPVEGKANEALIEFLASFFSVPASKVLLIRGASGRKKTVLLDGLSPEAVRQKLSGI